MQKYINNISKKKSFYKLYETEIKKLFSISIPSFIILGVIYAVWSNYEFIVSLFIDNLNLIINATYIVLVTLIISKVILFIRYLNRHTYIPISEAELEKNKIKTKEDYCLLIKYHFLGITPLDKLEHQLTLNFDGEKCASNYYSLGTIEFKDGIIYPILIYSTLIVYLFFFTNFNTIYQLCSTYFLQELLGVLTGIMLFGFILLLMYLLSYVLYTNYRLIKNRRIIKKEWKERFK